MKKSLKYFLFILAVSLFLTPSHVFSLDNLSSSLQPVGFRGIYWGASQSQHPYLFSMYDNVKGIEIFNRECDVLKLGKAELEEVAYYFYKDKFYGVSITLNSKKDYKPLLDALTEAYGTPEKVSDQYVWENNTVVIHLSSEGASIIFLPILNEIKL